MEDFNCECSEEYGPCENHWDVLAQREGARSRTADDLVYVFLTDVLAIAESEGVDIPADGRPEARNLIALREAESYWADETRWDDNYGCRWVREDVDAQIQDDIYVGENVLADLGLDVWWEDGYVIGKITGGPLAG